MKNFLSGDDPDAETINAALQDFGFYHLKRDVFRMYAEYVNRGHYGYAGGVIDQPEEYWQDMTTMKWLELWQKQVAPMPRLAPVSVFDTLRQTGRMDGNWLTYARDE